MKQHKIHWTQATWNPVVGCDKITSGCKNCYAEKMACRLASNPKTSYYKNVITNGKWNGKVILVEKKLNLPYHWKKPKLIFVNSMSDFYHRNYSFDTYRQLFKVMGNNTRHIFQILTKRPQNSKNYYGDIWHDNIWLGVTIENNCNIDRLLYLSYIPAKHKFISFEPLLSDVGTLNLKGIEWVIVGAESGQNKRECKLEWILNIEKQCLIQKVPFFFKGWGVPKNPLNEYLQYTTNNVFARKIQEFPKEMEGFIK